MKIIDWSEFLIESKSTRVFYLVDVALKENALIKKLPRDTFLFLSADSSKSITTSIMVWELLLQNHFHKKDLLVGIGGGSITDLTTFIAGTYKRGMEHVLVPTTLLAATDAAIGGKGGIDFGNFKNAVGVIKEPKFLVLHTEFFQTLSAIDQKFGWAEVVKHALIGAGDIYDELRNHQFKNINLLVTKSIEFKKSVVDLDLNEKDQRKILNFGHTFGHALESYQMSIQNPFSHGKCVVFGMMKELEIMCLLNKISDFEKEEIFHWISNFFPVQEYHLLEWKKVFPFLLNDKKNDGNLIGFVEFCGIGKVNPEMKIPLQTVVELLP